ncbi:MAG: CapA family protein [Hyphomicrobiaceae bacterium]|nr:CapA family protein [Hyphomicrobiaceae bacterium]
MSRCSLARSWLASTVACLLPVLAAPVARADNDRMTFRAGCLPGDRAVVAAVGDLLFHNALQRQALVAKSNYQRFWKSLLPVLQGADATYANLEGTAAEGVSPTGRAVRDPGRRWDGSVYGAGRLVLNYNYHPSLAVDLKESGFDVVSTANNHAADRGALGIDRTIATLDKAGIAHTGTRPRDAAEDRPWHVETKVGDMTVAWLACTYSVNGNPDRFRQVANCYVDRDEIMSEIRWLAADPHIAAVILTPHWGGEQLARPFKSDRQYARDAIEAGAAAIVGAHPHVLQGWEKITASDGRDGLVIYSTGNFISNQVSDDQRTGIVALIELTRDARGKAEVSAAGFIPTWVTRGKHRVDEMKIDARRGARAFSASLRRLPIGNHVTAQTYRQLPRSCAVTASN